jgi:hypothetical protein
MQQGVGAFDARIHSREPARIALNIVQSRRSAPKLTKAQSGYSMSWRSPLRVKLRSLGAQLGGPLCSPERTSSAGSVRSVKCPETGIENAIFGLPRPLQVAGPLAGG